MKKLFVLFLFFTLFLHTLFAYNVKLDSEGRPLYAADRIKVKLSEVATERLNSVLTEEGDYSKIGLDRLDNLFDLINVSKIKLAHRPVLDKVWEQENGFDRWYLLFVPIGTDIETAISNISRNEYIEHVNPEYLGYESATPNDPYFDDCWGHDNTSSNGPGSGHVVGFDSHIEEAWDGSQGYGSSSIIIAIIDSGVDYNHEDLDDNCVSGWDYGDGDSDPMDDSSAPGHGTCCAGIAAAEVNNSIGVSGVAGNCSIMPLKAKTSGAVYYDTAFNNALIHCGNNNVDIMSTSLGFGIVQGDSPARDASIQYAYDHGVTLLACTANGNTSSMTNPANDEHVIAVGAASPCAERKDLYSCDGQNWWGSNYGVNIMDAGDAVDVIAPTILPSTDITGTNGYSSGSYYMSFNGTSCATPYAAGVAALIKSKDPTLTPAEIRDILTSTATDVVDEGGVGWDRYTGYGMVNAGAAVGPNIWTGNLNEYWGNDTNWSLEHVPTATEDVEIPNVGVSCVVDFSDKVCRNLLIYSGATVIINDQSLTVHNDLDVYGDLSLTDTASRCYVNHDIRWHYGSTGSMTASATIDVKEDWDFMGGANVQFTAGYVDFSGTALSWIRSKEANCQFYRIRSDKSGGGTINVSNLSTDDLHVAANIYNYTGSVFRSASPYAVILGGFFNNLGGNFYMDDGTFEFNGNPTIVPLKPNVGDYFNNLTFSGSGTLSLDNTYSSDLQVNGNVELAGGTFAGNAFNITVGGGWTNSGGVFSPGTSLVTFDSNGDHQDVNGTNTFYDVLQIDNTNYLRFYGNTTIHDLELNYFSWAYNTFNVTGTLDINNPNSKFTANAASAIATIGNLDQGGTIFSNVGGSITINDLVESTIQGTYYANGVGGVINLSNGGAAVDLAGALNINGGTMNISGSVCWWPFGGNASITMTDGVIDVTDCGIYLASSNTLTEDITGGTIRTAFGFTGVRTDFNPAAGEIELYGTTDASLSMGVGSNFYDVLINKSGADNIVTKETKSSKLEKIRVGRDGIPVELTRSNTVNVTSDIDIIGDLHIDNGTFNVNSNTVDVQYDVYNYGTLIVDGTLDTGDDLFLYSGSVVDLSGDILLGTTTGMYGHSRHYSGSTFNQTDGDFYIETITLDNGSQFNGTGGITHMYVNGATPTTNNIDIDDPDSYFYQFYVDSGSNAALYSCNYDLYVSNQTWVYAPFDINGFTLSSMYVDVSTSGDLIINLNGVVDVRGNGPYFSSGGTLTMTTGSELNSASNIQFQAGSIENVSDGEINLGESFTNSGGIFTPTGGSVTFVGSSASSIVGTTVFHDLNINKTGSTVTTNAAFSMNDLEINSGILNSNGFDIEVYGNWTNNVGVIGFTEGTQTVTFVGANMADILTSETFYNMIVDKTYGNFEGLELVSGTSLHVLNDLTISDGTLEMNSNSILNVENDVQIDLDAGLNAYADTGLNLYIGGNWVNDNTDWDSIHGYSPGSENVTFYGSTDQFITTAAPQEDFGNLIIDKSGGEFRSNDNIRVIHDLDLIRGTWHDNASSLMHYFEGDFYVTAGPSALWSPAGGNTVVFKGTADQTVHNPFGTGYFDAIIVDKTAWITRSFDNYAGSELHQERFDTNLNEETRALTVTLISSIDLEWGTGLTIEEGTLDLNGNILYTMGDVVINDGGTLTVDDGAQLQIYGGDYLRVYSGGILEVLGSSGNLATVTNRSTGNYNFNVYYGGTISAEYGLFEQMTDNGVYVQDGAFVDPLHSFNYCTFQNGFVGPGTLLYVDNDEDLTITGANFPDASSTTYNVAKITNHGSITLEGFTGIFAGEAYEYDNNDPELIHWSAALIPIDDLTIQYNSGTNRIELYWTYPVPVDQFKVYRSTDPYDFTGATVSTTATVGYSEPATGTKYFYRVTAENISDNVEKTGKNSYSETAPWSK